MQNVNSIEKEKSKERLRHFNYLRYVNSSMKILIKRVQKNLSLAKKVNWMSLKNVYKILLKGSPE